MKSFRVLSLMLLFLIVPSLLFAQRPLSGEVRVSTDSRELQRFPHVATNRTGEFVVTWAVTHPNNDETSLRAVRFKANGTPATGELLIADQALDLAANSAVAMMDDGSFVVVFPDLDLATPALVARWYGPDGHPDGEDALVTRNWSPDFSISTQGDGGFVVAWEGSTPSVRARVFAPSHAGGSEIVIDPAGTDPVVAVGPQGAFVVAWRNGNIVARRFTPQGGAATDRFVVANVTAPQPLHIAKDESGNFLIVWGTGPTVFGQRYEADTTRIGGLLRLQAGGDYDMAMGGQGNFVLVWEAPGTGPQDGTNVFARRFKSSGSPLGPQLRVNVRKLGSQEHPQVGIGADGGFIVVWDSSAPDRSFSNVFDRRYLRK
ncbi:MAG TPA: hypothetical protein VLB76_15250 [Thermoanaerobaculia bacterium]|jgi:hypothetical protein|nr:hypothetical protein [Thermoanaerobaculia bacterium]